MCLLCLQALQLPRLTLSSSLRAELSEEFLHLPEPFFEGNDGNGSELCIQEADFQPLVVHAHVSLHCCTTLPHSASCNSRVMLAGLDVW